MCMVSNIGDGWGRTIPEKYPWLPYRLPEYPQVPAVPLPYTPVPAGQPYDPVPREEFDKLKQELEELKKLLQAAKKFDEATGQPDCEVDAKVKLIKDIAKLVGVDMGDVLEHEKKAT